MTEKVIFITGASRGVGAEVAKRVAECGAHTVLTYRNKRARAEAVAGEVQRSGREALLVQADITSEADMKRAFERVKETFGQLDVLVLNASGGLEKDKPADYAMTLNRDAQVQAIDLALPMMPKGSRVVFVTSHLAHFHGEKPVFPDYEPVAASKKAGERALRERIPDLEKRGIDLVVVSGDLIEGTITPKLLQRNAPGLIETRREQAGYLPTVKDFAEAIVDAAANTSLQTGATVYVGEVD